MSDNFFLVLLFFLFQIIFKLNEEKHAQKIKICLNLTWIVHCFNVYLSNTAAFRLYFSNSANRVLFKIIVNYSNQNKRKICIFGRNSITTSQRWWKGAHVAEIKWLMRIRIVKIHVLKFMQCRTTIRVECLFRTERKRIAKPLNSTATNVNHEWQIGMGKTC